MSLDTCLAPQGVLKFNLPAVFCPPQGVNSEGGGGGAGTPTNFQVRVAGTPTLFEVRVATVATQFEVRV